MRDKKSLILTRIQRFRTVTPVWIPRGGWDDVQGWSDVEEVPYNFSRSSIKFQGHTGWKIDDLNPIWVRLLGRSQLSNPLDLPCFLINTFSYFFVNTVINVSTMLLNSSLSSAAYISQWIGSTLVQIMACRIFGAKPLSKPMLGYHQLDPWEQTSVKI